MSILLELLPPARSGQLSSTLSGCTLNAQGRLVFSGQLSSTLSGCTMYAEGIVTSLAEGDVIIRSRRRGRR